MTTNKRRAPDDGDVSTTSSAHTSSSNSINRVPRTRNDYTKDGLTNYPHCSVKIKAFATRDAEIEERESELDKRPKGLGDQEKDYQDQVAKRNALQERRTIRERVHKEFSRSRELLRNKMCAGIDDLGPGKPKLGLATFEPLIAGLNRYISQLEDLDRQNLEAEKETMDDAELGKMRSDQERQQML